MTEKVFVPVDDVAGLLLDAYYLVAGLEGQHNETGIPSAKVRDWLAKFNYLIDRLNGNRSALHGRVLEALGTASMCWDPIPKGVFQEHEANRVGDELMNWIDEYASSLPVIRPRMSREEDTEQERLAASIYEISTRIGSGLVEKWSDAPEEIKHTLRLTAAELLQQEREAHQLVTTTVDDLLTPEEKKRFDEAISAQEEQISRIAHSGLPPNIPMPPGFQSGGEVRDG